MAVYERPSYGEYVATLARGEPTSTTTLRNRYEADLYKRFRGLKGIVRETVADNDALRLSATLAAPRNDFGFDTDAEKEAAFLDWLRDGIDDDVLEPLPREEAIAGQHYTAEYVRASSHQGADYAAAQLRDEGIDVSDEVIEASFARGAHRDKLRELYLRNYEALDGITSEMATQISRELSEGVAAGENPLEMARTINDRVDKVGITRARTMARTEVMHSHHSHAQVRYEEAGVEEFHVMPYNPCEICQELVANGPYPIDQLTSILPAHPRCMCAPSPAVD